MKGLILVGGLGTQLRPLTLSKPKPLIEFANKPQLAHIIEMLVHAGVTEIVLAINYRKEIMQEFLDTYQDKFGVKITCSQETEPLGTAGPIALAQELLDDGEPFFVMNCDVACHFSMKGLLDFHRAHGKVGTIMVTRVEEPAKYGKSVVLSHETGLIDRFVEHGRTYHGNWINAGVYIFSPAIFERIALRPTSMEREVLPELAAADDLEQVAADLVRRLVLLPLLRADLVRLLERDRGVDARHQLALREREQRRAVARVELERLERDARRGRAADGVEQERDELGRDHVEARDRERRRARGVLARDRREHGLGVARGRERHPEHVQQQERLEHAAHLLARRGQLARLLYPRLSRLNSETACPLPSPHSPEPQQSATSAFLTATSSAPPADTAAARYTSAPT